jgi:hypothetical protein
MSAVMSFKVLLTNAAPFKAMSAFPASKFCCTYSTALFNSFIDSSITFVSSKFGGESLLKSSVISDNDSANS